MLGIGIDIVDVDRMRNVLSGDNEAFIRRVFTKQEILNSYKFKNRAEYFSFLFAFKECFVKAKGLGFISFAAPKHIEIKLLSKQGRFKKTALKDTEAYFKNKKINLIGLRYFKLENNLVCELVVRFNERSYA